MERVQKLVSELAAKLPAPVADFVTKNQTAVTAVAGVSLAVVLARLLKSKTKGSYAAQPSLLNVNSAADAVKAQTDAYTHMHREESSGLDDRKTAYAAMVNAYYTLVTDFYEYGWGESFHFAHRFPHESRLESIVRHEYWLAAQMGLKPGMKVLDLGCGVGGPARNIARFSGCSVLGINNNQYQVDRATAKAVRDNLSDRVTFKKADFMNLPVPDNSYDAAYAIEATCHAPDRTACFTQIFKALKPGAVFAGYEWVMTDRYDPNNKEQQAIKKGIEIGDGLPDITGVDGVVNALKGAGFVVEAIEDLAETSPVAWYQPFLPTYSDPRQWKITPLGIFLTNVFVRTFEFLRLIPQGTTQMHDHLVTGAKTLRAGGEQRIFTPMLFFKAYKPAN